MHLFIRFESSRSMEEIKLFFCEKKDFFIKTLLSFSIDISVSLLEGVPTNTYSVFLTLFCL